MAEWETLTDEEGRTYYYNTTTNETSWTLPSQSSSQWQAFKTDDGKEYYYNETTGVTTWDKPEGFDSTTTETVDTEMATEATQGAESAAEAVADPLEQELEAKPCSSDELIKPPQFETVLDAEKAFTAMLKDNRVDSTWSFQSVMSKFIKEPVYWAIPDALQRKKLYDDYLVSRLKEELSDKTAVVEKFEKNFKLVLQEYHSKGILKHNTRWLSIKNQLIKEDNSIFKHSILSDNEIWEIFSRFRADLEKQHTENIETQKRQALSELEAYLTQINPSVVKESKGWENLYESLKVDSRFHANKHFAVLSKVDILELYRTKIYPTPLNSIKDEVTKAERINYRSDRKARDNFKALLSKILINANTEFKQVFELIEDEDAFIELCGRNGSTPIEFFWDIVDEKNQLLKLKKEWIQGVMTDLKKSDPQQTFEKLLESKEIFIEVLSKSNDERLKSIDFALSKDSNQTEIELLYDVIKKDHETQKEATKANFGKSLKGLILSLADWLYFNNDKVKVFNLLEGLDESLEDSNAKSGVVSLMPSKNDDGSIQYSLVEEFDIAKVLLAFGDLEHFKSIQASIEKFHQEIPGDSSGLVEQSAKDAVTEYISVLNSKQRKRKVREDSEDREAKRARVDEPVKPMTMNY
ncbi:uncharacterized protein CANTADRAFT_27095 [Suhomyces tanzawaensis NRRL Y-17324]|uniref:Pre-mRNA-processing protein PRP40 n=1 Tax=Suhomyces tanzawaensis NRRL Y-17324 TaxID=984487 RepID=A0A1E4SFF4_9ASCO|nr:uncharacterized protein CANTADRAFT_27095 [Suhomyces tanzawaensis NRRL Y-17324]ODV78206.1 hypothetical protein CANTADRAFT_27095 [Suhomyces tanzawaensis NRRL Y-17324]